MTYMIGVIKYETDINRPFYILFPFLIHYLISRQYVLLAKSHTNKKIINHRTLHSK